jgi:hypothetical protein
MGKIFYLLVSFCLTSAVLADDALVTDLPLVFSEDFDAGHDRWELTDDKAWTLREVEGDNVFGLNKRTSDYTPKIRSPHNIALVKDLELSDFIITFKVKSTNDTGNHRDCCVFFLPHRSNSLLLLPSSSVSGKGIIGLAVGVGKFKTFQRPSHRSCLRMTHSEHR